MRTKPAIPLEVFQDSLSLSEEGYSSVGVQPSELNQGNSDIDGEVGPAWIPYSQLASDRQILAEVFPSRSRVALPDSQRSQLVVGDGQVALVVGAVGLGVGEPAGDVEGLLVQPGRLVAAADRDHQVAQLVVGDGQVALVVGAVGLGVGPLLVTFNEFLVAADGLFGEAARNVGLALDVGHNPEVAVAARKVLEHLPREGGHGEL